jgi:hypothetical protein
MGASTRADGDPGRRCAEVDRSVGVVAASISAASQSRRDQSSRGGFTIETVALLDAVVRESPSVPGARPSRPDRRTLSLLAPVGLPRFGGGEDRLVQRGLVSVDEALKGVGRCLSLVDERLAGVVAPLILSQL